MDTLRETIGGFTDERLLEMYGERGDYTESAVEIIEGEMARRGLDAAVAEEAREQAEVAEAAAAVSRDDFEKLKHPFTRADLATANAVLQDGRIPYIIEKCDAEKTLCCAPVFKDAYTSAAVPSSDVMIPLYAVLVRKDALERAYRLIDEHFEPAKDGCYALRRSDFADRLKMFSPSDIKFTDKAAQEAIDVNFEDNEKIALAKLAGLLLGEADRIEEERGIVVFFYDCLEPLIAKLGKNGDITRVDFLTIIEMCQIYREDLRYDRALDHVAEQILDFLTADS